MHQLQNLNCSEPTVFAGALQTGKHSRHNHLTIFLSFFFLLGHKLFYGKDFTFNEDPEFLCEDLFMR